MGGEASLARSQRWMPIQSPPVYPSGICDMGDLGGFAPLGPLEAATYGPNSIQNPIAGRVSETARN
jgi:hypothetical protein